MDWAREEDFSATLTQADCTKNLKLLPTFPASWAGRRGPSLMDCDKLRQRELGELRRVAAVSRPDIRARLALTASGINALRRSDVFRVNELIRVAEDW